MRTALSLLFAAGLVGARARGALASEGGGWRIDPTVYGYLVPDQPDFVMAVVPADARWFHLEGRYNYEGIHTGSIFLGLNGGAGEKVRLDATAMLGGVFGDRNGVAPACRITLSWWKLDFSTENEYLVDVHDLGASFFYSWTELGFSPYSWLRLGMVGQRTRVIDTGLDVQRGLLVGTSFRSFTATFYELNLGWKIPTYIGAIGATF